MARFRITQHPSSLYDGMAYTAEIKVFFTWRGMSTFASFLEAESFIFWYESVGSASSKTTIIKEYNL